MVRDTSDFGALPLTSPVYPVTDLGELAVRRGSIVSFDRRGNVIWLDDFESSLNKWSTVLSGTGAAAAISTVRARNGESSALLTAGSTASRQSTIEHFPPFPGLSRLGFEFSFSLGSTIESLTWQIYVYTGTREGYFSVRWLDATNSLGYEDVNSAFVTFATGVNLLAAATTFHTGKLVVDPTNWKYIRFVLDSVQYSLKDIAVLNIASSQEPHLEPAITLIGRAGVNDTVYIDDAILTVNEPP